MLKLPTIAIVFLSIGLTSVTSGESVKYTELVEQVANNLKENYVFPKIGAQYANGLEECLKNSCVDDIEDDKQLASKLTELLNGIYEDKHLRVFAPGERPQMRRPKPATTEGKQQNGLETISKQEILEGNIGYIKFNGFPRSRESVQMTREAMIAMKDTDALIFDIRDHRGGTPTHIDEIAGFIYEEPTHIMTMQSPHRNDGKPIHQISQPNEYSKYYQDKPVYMLTSERSGSAAEHFAMSMKVSGRGIIIGETTRGMGHWGGIVPLVGDFSMFMPMGRSYHPVNKLGWEGIGVTPDIEIDEVESLEYALERIRRLH